MNGKIDRAAELIREVRRVVAFTGAGISEESGIPTYRDKDGLWQKYDQDKVARIDYFLQDPSHYWRFFREMRGPMLERARPNQGHMALARLEAQGKLSTVITQNIDGLHQLAGSTSVVELHGTARHSYCMSCGEKVQIEDVLPRLESELPPKCIKCGGTLRPAVVFFGESLSPRVLEEATTAAQSSDLLIAVGSSLVVHPAAAIPEIARANGSRLIIINLEPTPADVFADVVFHDRAGTVLPQILARLGAGSQ